MKYNPNIHHRQSIRLRGYDYSQPGAYFITICTQHHECCLGEIINGEIKFTIRGAIAFRLWLQIPHHFPNVELDEFIIMPNHLHGIIVITDKFIDARGDIHAERGDTGRGDPAPTAAKTYVGTNCCVLQIPNNQNYQSN